MPRQGDWEGVRMRRARRATWRPRICSTCSTAWGSRPASASRRCSPRHGSLRGRLAISSRPDTPLRARVNAEYWMPNSAFSIWQSAFPQPFVELLRLPAIDNSSRGDARDPRVGHGIVRERKLADAVRVAVDRKQASDLESHRGKLVIDVLAIPVAVQFDGD